MSRGLPPGSHALPVLGLLPRIYTPATFPLSSKMIGSSAAGPFFEVVFALLVTELAIIGMLCVPVPGGLLRPVVRWVSTSSMLASLAKPLIWFGTLVGLSFLFTTREMLKLQEEYHDAKEYHDLGQKLQEDPHPNPNPNPNPGPNPSPSPSPNQSAQLALKALRKVGEACRASREHDVRVPGQVLGLGLGLGVRARG